LGQLIRQYRPIRPTIHLGREVAHSGTANWMPKDDVDKWCRRMKLSMVAIPDRTHLGLLTSRTCGMRIGGGGCSATRST
jgi:hypothetical protein